MKKRNVITFIFMFIILFQESIEDFLDLSFISYLDEVVVLAFFAYGIKLIIDKKKMPKISIYLLVLMVIFSIIGIISCLVNSESNFIKILVSNFLVIKFWMIIFSFTLIDIGKEDKENVINQLVNIEKVVIVFAIFNLIFPNLFHKIFPFTKISYRFGIASLCSIFNHQGKYGWFMLLCGIIHFIKFYNNRQKYELKRTCISIIFAILSMRTKVIMSMVMIFVGFFIYYILSKDGNIKAKVKKIIPIILIALCVLFIFKDLLGNTYTLYFTNTKGVSARQSLLINSFQIMKDYFPLGVGFGKYGTWIARTDYSEYYYEYEMDNIYGLRPDKPIFATDTFWPGIFGETGVIGTIIYISMIILIIYYLYRCIKLKYDDINYRQIASIALLALIQTIIESFGEPSFNSGPQNLVVAIIVGISIVDICKMEDNNEEENEIKDEI